MSQTLILINFWDKGGMRHYADSIAQLMSETARVIYVSNYPVHPHPNLTHWHVPLTLNPLSPRNIIHALRLGFRILKTPGSVYMTSDHPVLLLIYKLFIFKRASLVIHDARTHHGERLHKQLFHWLHLNLFSICLSRFVVHSQKIRGELPLPIRLRHPRIIPHVNYQLITHHFPALAPPTWPNEGPFRLLFFGRILAYKGLHVLYEAMENLPEDHFHLTVAGDGVIQRPYTGSNHQLFNHFISDEQMHQLFSQCHAVALPYTSASQSGVAYMALAYGKPVISTRVGAIPEVIHHAQNGLLTDPDDPEALAKAIRDMAEPRVYQQITQNIATDTQTNFAEVTAGIREVCFE